MLKYSTLLITREMQIKAMERYYYILSRMIAIKVTDNTKCKLVESYIGTNKLSTLLVERYQKYIVGR